MLQCKCCFEALEDRLYLGIFEGKRPKLEKTETNERILEAFCNKGWISKYETYKEKYYRAIGRKYHPENSIPVELL